MNTPKIYVACLASYNNGELYGEWINADQDEFELLDEINEMLKSSPIDMAEEFAIHDYEGFGSIKIDEYDSMETISKYALFIEEHGEIGTALLENYNTEEAITLLNEHYQGVFDDEEDFAYHIIENCYCADDLPDFLMRYFDYASFARDLFINDYFSLEISNKVHVFSNL